MSAMLDLLSSIVGLSSFPPINQEDLLLYIVSEHAKTIKAFLFYSAGGPVHPFSLASQFCVGMSELILSCQTLNLATVNNSCVVQCSLMS